MIRPLKDLEREAILAACQETQDRQRAARELGIGSTTLYRKLREYGVQSKREPELRCPKCGTRMRNNTGQRGLYGHLQRRHGLAAEEARKLAWANSGHHSPEENGEGNGRQKPDARNFEKKD